jgi:hypothetical protein
MKQSLRRNLGWGMLLCLGLTACDQFIDQNPREAWEATMRVRLARDYAALWDSLASESQAQVEKTLAHIKRNPNYLSRMNQKFNLPIETLMQMDPKGFFLALMTAVERNQPEIVNLQMQSAQGAKFVRTQIREDRAVVSWLSGTGKEEKTYFIRETGTWRPVLQRQ